MQTRNKSGEHTDFAAIDAALKRAAKAAHSLARKTKTPCYIWQDGAIVDVATSREKQSGEKDATGATK